MERKSRRLDGPPRYAQCIHSQEQSPDSASPIFPILHITKTSLGRDIQKRDQQEALMEKNKPSPETIDTTRALRQTDRDIARKEERLRWIDVLSRRTDVPDETVREFISSVKKEEKKQHKIAKPQTPPEDPLERLVFKNADETTELNAREAELDTLFRYREEQREEATDNFAQMIGKINDSLGQEVAEYILSKVSALTKALVDREEIRTEKAFKNALKSSAMDEEMIRHVWDNYRERTAAAFDE